MPGKWEAQYWRRDSSWMRTSRTHYIQTVQLANAAVEIDALRQRLFELHSYQIAYERLLGEQPSPRT